MIESYLSRYEGVRPYERTTTMCDRCGNLNDIFGNETLGSTQDSEAMTLQQAGYWCNITGKGIQITGSFVERLTSLVDAGSRFVGTLSNLTQTRVTLTEARTRRDEVANRRLEILMEEAKAQRMSRAESATRTSSLIDGLLGGRSQFSRFGDGRY